MVTMAMDGTFDVCLMLPALHKIVAVNCCCCCCWAFDKDPFERLRRSNKPVMSSDAMHRRANHPNALAKQLMLQNQIKSNRES